MLHFASNAVPATVEALRDGIEATLHRLLVMPAGRVAVSGTYPNLQDLVINLDGATLRTDLAPQRPKAAGEKRAGPGVGRLVVHGRPMHANGSYFELALEAEEALFVFDRDDAGRLLMLPEDAKSGRFEASILKVQLERLLMSGANAALGKAVNITAVAMVLRQTGARSLAFEARVTAKKLISTMVRIEGRVDMDEALNAKVGGLSCVGEGMVGRAVSGLLGPYLQRVEGRKWPLMGLSLGKLRLRDVRLDVAEGLRIEAAFGRE